MPDTYKILRGNAERVFKFQPHGALHRPARRDRRSSGDHTGERILLGWDGCRSGPDRAVRAVRHLHAPGTGHFHACRSRDLKHVPLAGPGMIEGFTVNWQRWAPSLDVPYGLADVSFPSYPGVRMLGRLHHVDLTTLTVGLLVDVGVDEGPGGTKVPAFTPWPG